MALIIERLDGVCPHIFSMTDEAYIAAYQKLTREYQDNRLSMEDYLTAVQELKAEYLKGKPGAALPVVP